MHYRVKYIKKTETSIYLDVFPGIQHLGIPFSCDNYLQKTYKI